MTNKEKLQDYSLRIDNVTERIKELTLEKQYYKDNCVLYIAQTKTDTEKEIARQNINAQVAGDYVLKSDFDTSLNSYVTKTELSTDLEDYVTKTKLATDLENYITKTELTTQLTSYVTKNNLEDSLNLYVTDKDLTSTLQSYTTTSALNEALKAKQNVGDYVLKTELPYTISNNQVMFSKNIFDNNSFPYIKGLPIDKVLFGVTSNVDQKFIAAGWTKIDFSNFNPADLDVGKYAVTMYNCSIGFFTINDSYKNGSIFAVQKIIIYPWTTGSTMNWYEIYLQPSISTSYPSYVRSCSLYKTSEGVQFSFSKSDESVFYYKISDN